MTQGQIHLLFMGQIYTLYLMVGDPCLDLINTHVVCCGPFDDCMGR